MSFRHQAFGDPTATTMDIFTHIAIAAAASAPWWATHPLEATAFVFGSVLPDVDANARMFGKVAYLRAHQTWTHAFAVHAVIGGLGATAAWWAGWGFLIPSITAACVGAALHSLLDLTNTYGVRAFAPFDGRRFALEWVFFVDAFVVGTTGLALATQAYVWLSAGRASIAVWAVWFAASVAYWGLRAHLRQRAGKRAPDAVSLVPSAWVPWRYYGFSVDGRRVETFTVDAVSGRRSALESTPLPDEDPRAAALPEVRAMRELSPGFLACESGGGRIVYRDFRTRNFGTQFGTLVVRLNAPDPSSESGGSQRSRGDGRLLAGRAGPGRILEVEEFRV